MEAIEQETIDQEYLADRQETKKRKGLWWKISLCILGVLVVLTVAAAIAVWNLNEFSLQLSVLGEQEITVEYGESFTDPGAQAYFSGTLLLRKPLAVEVTVDNTVDTSQLGTYALTYTASYTIDYYLGTLDFSQNKTRTVHVTDTQMPVITLVSDPDSYTIPGQEYAEEGFTATDNYDGDVTALVQREVAEGMVVYTVTDSSGNSTQVVREIVYHDPIAPTLTLNGYDWVNHTKGSAFTDPGCVALDNCDGDITEKITVTGGVDVNTPGTYTITYTVTDSYNNTTSVTRTVVVKEPAPVVMPEMPPATPQTPVAPTGKVIYLTFDDGPSQHTARLLDILDQYGVKATFFVMNTQYLHLLPRIAASGHTLAMHTSSHRYNEVYASESAYFDDLKHIQDTIHGYTGITATLLRFPGGSSNTISKQYNYGIMTRLATMVNNMGYRYFDWNVDSNDAGGARSAAEVFNNVVNGASKRDVSIVLQHDTKGYSVDAVESIIQWGLANGYTFLALDASSPVCAHPINN